MRSSRGQATSSLAFVARSVWCASWLKIAEHRFELAPMLPQMTAAVLTEPCNFADKAGNLLAISLRVQPGRDHCPARNVSIRGIYAGCRAQLFADCGPRRSAAPKGLRGPALSC